MNKTTQVHEFSSVQVNWPKPTADRFTEFAAKIPDIDVYIDPDDSSFGREEAPHITVKYGLHTSDPDEVKSVVLGTGPISVEAGEIKIFKSEKYDVIVVKIKSPELLRLNKEISSHLKVTDTHPTYKPHLTIAYVKPGCGEQYDGDTRFSGMSATFNLISFSAKDGKIYQISLNEVGEKFVETSDTTATSLMAKVRELRKKYKEWKQKHPEQESEEMINEFLLLKEKLAEKGIRLPKQDTPLDRDAEAFEKRIKIIPFLPEPGKVFKFTDGQYAPVNPSGNIQGPPISLSDFEPHFRDFLAASPVIWAVGGIVEHDSTVNDCDILCSFPTEEELQRIIDFRLFRMLPEDIADRASFLHEQRGSTSPFTDCLPLYRLKLERIPDAEIIRMSEAEMSFAEIVLRAKGAKKQEREANISMREDRVVLGRYFKAMKPYKIAPPLERQSIDAFLAAIEKEGIDPGWLSSKKFDGFRTTLHIKKGKLIRAYSDDGLDNTEKFPQAAAEAKDLWPDQDLVLDAEIEWLNYKRRQHMPREVAASYLRRKGVFDDSSLCINVFDCIYLDKDIHNEPFSERWKKLKKLNFPQSTNACPNKDYRWNLIPHYLSETIEEIREHTEKVSKAFGSEGNVAKKADSIHTLTGKRIGWIKWHRTSLLYGLVTDVFETKVEGVYNIEWSVDPGSYPISKKNTREVRSKKFLLGGKTFATTLEPKIGKDIIQIELETLNFIHDKRSGTFDISAWAPRFLRIATDRKTPDSVADAVKRAIKNRVYQEKIIKPDGSVNYLPGASAEEFPSKI